MKQNIKQTLIAIVGLLLSTTTLAHDFEVGGIYYDYLDNTAKTSPPDIQVGMCVIKA